MPPSPAPIMMTFILFVGGIVEDDVWNLGTFWLEVLVAI
jgi:hypothetical protein